ncbi:FMN-dependent NADH-azoreductase [Mycolicibacterium sp. CBMA 226]|uniref:FMN-dependent NADH-azoreductase n=1 Tax=Mycolicibacterium sp. CBMA 226 TaxID=2606611 RepID=UPI0012DC36DC|nr:NAD(P)H-dependent oxidoreductase [Mycolicibacterium sp. CBMA 226]MUL77208.1 FMN-dependent NADH-azoreductase [Mycolicibacterium sp. CBMA 226]
MTKLLYLQASSRKRDSRSSQIATAYLDVLTAANPDLEIDILDLWDTELPAFDGDKAAAKMNVIKGAEQDGVGQTAWDEIVAIADRFVSADRYLIASPMWNSGIPYRLKHFIDLVHQPGILWSLDREAGYQGLLTGKHATLVLTSGVYAPGVAEPAFGVDHHAAYLRMWLNQAGVQQVDEVRFQPTMLTGDPAGDLTKALEAAEKLAATHGYV